jgi:hypothetical protein
MVRTLKTTDIVDRGSPMKPARISQVVRTYIVWQIHIFRASNKLKNQVVTCECDCRQQAINQQDHDLKHFTLTLLIKYGLSREKKKHFTLV